LAPMVFKSTTGSGLARGLPEAAAWGYPGPEGLFAPFGEGDIRSAVYAPEASFSETAASLLAAMFTEDLDPVSSERIAERAFPHMPAIYHADEEIPLVDLAAGPTGSSADYGAALLVELLGLRPRTERPILIVAPEGPWGAAIVEAASDRSSLSVLLLCGEEGARGVKPHRLLREGGRTLLLGLRGSDLRRLEFLRSLSGRRLADFDLVVSGPGNPVELSVRIMVQAATFSELHHGSSGEIFAALPLESSLSLASGLWAWRLGLPLTGLLVPTLDGPESGAQAETGESGAFELLIERFIQERSGLLGSLLRYQPVSEVEALAARESFREAGGPPLDRVTSFALAAAKKSLAPRLRGHSRIVVHRYAHPFWDRSANWRGEERPAGLDSALAGARLDALADPETAALEAILARLV